MRTTGTGCVGSSLILRKDHLIRAFKLPMGSCQPTGTFTRALAATVACLKEQPERPAVITLRPQPGCSREEPVSPHALSLRGHDGSSELCQAPGLLFGSHCAAGIRSSHGAICREGTGVRGAGKAGTV